MSRFFISYSHADRALAERIRKTILLVDHAHDVFPSEFFRLLYGIYQRPTFYRVKHDVCNDDAGGYLFNIWIECSREFANLIDFVEYRFDYEFDYDGYNKDRIGGAVHKETNRASGFKLRGLWTSESITVFVAIYLRNTRVVYFRECIDVGTAVN